VSLGSRVDHLNHKYTWLLWCQGSRDRQADTHTHQLRGVHTAHGTGRQRWKPWCMVPDDAIWCHAKCKRSFRAVQVHCHAMPPTQQIAAEIELGCSASAVTATHDIVQYVNSAVKSMCSITNGHGQCRVASSGTVRCRALCKRPFSLRFCKAHDKLYSCGVNDNNIIISMQQIDYYSIIHKFFSDRDQNVKVEKSLVW